MGSESTYKLSMEYSALPSHEQRLDRDGSLCCGKKGVVIGRAPAPESHLQIDLEFVSWRHATVSCVGKSFFIEDCDSTDGTLLNSHKLDIRRKYQLLAGDIISIGDQLIEVAIPPWEEIIDTNAESPHDDFNYLITSTTEETPDPSEDHPELPAATADNNRPDSDEPAVSNKADDMQSASPINEKSLISSFIAGLEFIPEDLKLQPDDYQEFLNEMGQALFHAIDGVRKALYTHDSFRDQFSIPGTMMNRSQLNPLYNTRIDTREVIKILLTSRSKAIAGPVDAILEATDDFYLHGIAVPTAVDESIRSMLEIFDWRVLEKEFETSPGFASFGPLKKSRFWELFCTEYDRQVKTLDEYDNSFRRVVAKAYSRARKRELINGSIEESNDAE